MQSKGTEIFFAVDDTIYTLACPTGVNVPSATKEQVETTCLNDLDKTFEPGSGTPPTLTINSNFNPAQATHVQLYNLQKTGQMITWFVGFPDGTADPDFDSAGAVVLPSTRTFIYFEGYLSDVPIDIQLGAIITIEFIIQMSGNTTLVPKTP